METLKDIKLTARKDHICNFCECVINRGTKYRKQTNKYEDYIYDFKTHIECEEVAQLLDMYDEVDDCGLTGCDFQNFIDENNDDFDKSYYERVQIILNEKKEKCVMNNIIQNET